MKASIVPRSPAAPAALLLFASLLGAPASGQPRDILPPRPIDLSGDTRVEAQLDGGILQVGCTQTFTNRGGRLEEVEVLLPIPADAVVTDGLLLADGREYPAEVLPADEARRIYEQIVRARRDPALLELAGHGLIRLSAFPIPPGGTRSVSFRYHRNIPASEGRMRLLFPVATLCGLGRTGPLEFGLRIDGRDPLVQVYSPSHDLDIDRDGSTSAEVRFASDHPDPHETIELVVVRDAEPIGVDLRTARGHREDDYFLLAVSPGWELLRARRSAPEKMIFVLDTSGSMEGEKFEQARRALRRMLDEISPEDRFNLIAFSSGVQTLFDGGPRRASKDARRRARGWLDRLAATGGTAIADAIDEASRQADGHGLVLFLTDGLPTVGEKDHDAILRHAARGGRDVRFYAFGVGYDVDATLLDDLAREGGGSVSYVRPGEDVEEAVTMLRRRVEHPCARNVRLEIEGARIRDLFPEGPVDLFAGEPLIFAGRARPGAGRATVLLAAEGPDGRMLRGRWRVDFEDPEARSSAVPVLWASRKAASLIDRIRREGHDRAALAELTELSRRYGILNEEVALLAREEEPVLAFRDTPRMSAKNEVDLSAKAWSLHEVKARSEVAGSERGAQAATLAAGEVTFRREGDLWIDTRLDDPVPRGTETIRVRAFGAAYFDLAGAGGRLAEWLAVGERVRVLLPGILLEIGPEGEETLPEATLARIREAAESA